MRDEGTKRSKTDGQQAKTGQQAEQNQQPEPAADGGAPSDVTPDAVPAGLEADAPAPAAEQSRSALDEQRDKYLRLAAEYDNFRKRATRERSEAASRGQSEIVKQLLDPLDDLARFAHLEPDQVDARTVVEGAAMVERKLHKALSTAGLTVLNPVDQSFDPNFHEAVATEPAMSAEDDHVVARVYQLGYLFNGQLLRPARVVVKQWNG
jgi:molecular chaperone GrpE